MVSFHSQRANAAKPGAMLGDGPGRCAYSQGREQFSAIESGADTDGHIVACDSIYQRPQQCRHGQWQRSAKRLDDAKHFKTLNESRQLLELRILEMMEKQARHQAATRKRVGTGNLEKIVLVPMDRIREVGGSRSDVEPSQPVFCDCAVRGRRSPAVQFSQQGPLSGPDFHDSLACSIRMVPQLSENPTLVAHEEIDHAQVGPTADCFWICRIKAVQNFRDDYASIQHAST